MHNILPLTGLEDPSVKISLVDLSINLILSLCVALAIFSSEMTHSNRNPFFSIRLY